MIKIASRDVDAISTDAASEPRPLSTAAIDVSTNGLADASPLPVRMAEIGTSAVVAFQNRALQNRAVKNREPHIYDASSVTALRFPSESTVATMRLTVSFVSLNVLVAVWPPLSLPATADRIRRKAWRTVRFVSTPAA